MTTIGDRFYGRVGEETEPVKIGRKFCLDRLKRCFGGSKGSLISGK